MSRLAGVRPEMVRRIGPGGVSRFNPRLCHQESIQPQPHVTEKPMQIDEVLTQQAKANADAIREDVYYMTGGIAPDPDGSSFRFYHDPSNPRSYIVIDKESIVGDVYPLTDSERAHHGFVKTDVFRVGLPHGTKVKSVSTTIETIGETISAETTLSPRAAGTCHYTSGCSSKCCTTGSDGKCYCDTCCIA